MFEFVSPKISNVLKSLICSKRKFEFIMLHLKTKQDVV